MTFQLDTSGIVHVERAVNITGYICWDDLTPFTQGYVEALLGSLTPQPGQWFYMASGGVNIGATFVSFGSHNGVEDRAWSLVHLDRGGKRCAGPKRLELTSKLVARFSDLASETLDRIIADCAIAQKYGPGGVGVSSGEFWEDRQAGRLLSFPPLTVQLGDDGKVRFV